MRAADGSALFDQILLNHVVATTTTTRINPITDLPTITNATAHGQGFDFNNFVSNFALTWLPSASSS